MGQWMIRERMRVHGAHGEWLGWVSGVAPEHFEVTHFAHPTRFWDVRLDQVADVHGNDVVLRHGWESAHLIEEHDGGALPPRGTTEEELAGEPVDELPEEPWQGPQHVP